MSGLVCNMSEPSLHIGSTDFILIMTCYERFLMYYDNDKSEWHMHFMQVVLPPKPDEKNVVNKDW